MKLFFSSCLFVGIVLANGAFAGSDSEISAHVALNQDAVIAMLTHQLNHCVSREEKFYLNGIKPVTQTYANGTVINVVSYRYNGKIVEQFAAIQVKKTVNGTQVIARDYPDAFNHTLRVAQSVKYWLQGNRECLTQSWGMS